MGGYDASSIKVLSGMEAVRRRPGMYIGDTDDGSGLHQMLWAVVGCSMDEHFAGGASYLRVAFDGDGGVTVEDDGRGIPLDPAPHEPDLTVLELVMTRLHGELAWRQAHLHAAHPLWCVGVAVVNALSSRLEAEVCRDGRRYVQNYAAGLALGPVRDVGPTDRRGTRIRFTPDFSLLVQRPWNRALVARRLRELAATSPRLTTILDDHAFRCPSGLVDHARFLSRGHASLHGEPVHISGTESEVGVDLALLWTKRARPCVRGFVGHVRTQKGTHIRGLARGLFHAFGELDPARFANVHRAAFDEVLHPGLVAAIHVTLAHPRFGNPRSDHLDNPEVLTAVDGVVTKQLAALLRDDRQLRETLLARMPPVSNPAA